jgi:hypothetical protein
MDLRMVGKVSAIVDEDPEAFSALRLSGGETDIARTNGLAVIDNSKSERVKIETRESPGGSGRHDRQRRDHLS